MGQPGGGPPLLLLEPPLELVLLEPPLLLPDPPPELVLLEPPLLLVLLEPPLLLLVLLEPPLDVLLLLELPLLEPELGPPSPAVSSVRPPQACVARPPASTRPERKAN